MTRNHNKPSNTQPGTWTTKGGHEITWRPSEERLTVEERAVVVPRLVETVIRAFGDDDADVEKVKDTLSMLLPFFQDAYRCGIDLSDTREVLSETRIADVLRSDQATAYTSKLTYRSRAREVRCLLFPETKPKLTTRKVKGQYENPRAPYLERRLEDFYLRARTEGTAYRSTSVCAGMSLSAGAGAPIKDLRYTKVKDLEPLDNGMLVVHFPAEGRAERSVPVSPLWASRLLEATSHLSPGDYVFLPNFMDREYRDIANQVIARSTDLATFSFTRARVHWMVTQLGAGIDLLTLTYWAGLAKCEGVARYARFLTPTEPTSLYDASVEAIPHGGDRS